MGVCVLTWECVHLVYSESSVPMATTTINCWYHGNHYNELLVPWQPMVVHYRQVSWRITGLFRG